MRLARRQPIQFGYFTLSDNHYDNNTGSANDFVADIIDEAVFAEEVGLHSAWIGEHHFSTLGVLSYPDLVLANVASFSQPSIELAGRLGCGVIVAPFAAAMTYGGLRQVRELYHETCARHGRPRNG
jgi:alkanesulfonate monooxygenase SsuD/methylene tetrahydromethanopterin reductase-like flavin-dependent oxidoreductase (luciferase family)